VDAKSSKSSFSNPETGKEHFAAFETHLLAQMRGGYQRDWPGIVFCHLENEDRVKEAVERCKVEAQWGDAPVHVLHWGQHRATNRYRDCRWVFFWGVQYLPRGAVAALAIGQVGRLDYHFMDREIQGIIESEISEGIYQALSRGHSRQVIEGEAGPQVVDLVLPGDVARNVLPLLEQVMPGVTITQLAPECFAREPRKNAQGYIELARRFAAYLEEVPANTAKISARKINKHFGVDGNADAVRNAYKYLLSELRPDWVATRRSLVRRVQQAGGERREIVET
jgi:hypothetical protein